MNQNFTPIDDLVKKWSKQPHKKSLFGLLLGVDIFFHFIMTAILVLFTVLVYRPAAINTFLFNADAKAAVFTSSPRVEKDTGSVNPSSPVYINQQKITASHRAATIPRITVSGPFKREVFAYFPYWLVDQADTVVTSAMTDISYFGLTVGANGNFLQEDGWIQWTENEKLHNLIQRLRRNKVRVHLTVKSFFNTDIEQLVRSPDASQRFINAVVYEANSQNLDGINIDFEYVGVPSADVRNQFSLLMSKLNKELKRQHPQTQLTIATYVSAASVTQLWDLPFLAQHSDGFVIMGYDFTTAQSSQAGPVAPLSGREFSLTSIINEYLEKVSAEKMILALPFYGYDWAVKTATENAEAVAQGSGRAVPYSDIIASTNDQKLQWNEDTQTPWYSYQGDDNHVHVVHFDNIRSLGIKFDFVNTKNLKGVGIWALGFEGNDPQVLQLLADKFTN